MVIVQRSVYIVSPATLAQHLFPYLWRQPTDGEQVKLQHVRKELSRVCSIIGLVSIVDSSNSGPFFLGTS